MPICLKRDNAFSSLNFDNVTEVRRMHAYVGSRFTIKTVTEIAQRRQLRDVSSVCTFITLSHSSLGSQRCLANIELREIELARTS